MDVGEQLQLKQLDDAAWIDLLKLGDWDRHQGSKT
jgi:hypothetical protein